MSTDLTRVYQFLAAQGDWLSAMDCEKSDGTITKSEFRAFMEENFTEWNGETTDLNDLINNFWKKFDTKQTGNLSGTNYKNKNALDTNEIASLDKKIAYYEILNDYTSTLQAPSVISNSSPWKKSVSDGLAALVEKYTGSEEELLKYLEEASPIIENKATADYCKEEYLNGELKSLLDEYDYNNYNDGGELKSLIDNYIQTLTGDEDAGDIQETVISIIDAFFATAGLKEDNGYDLSKFGYNPNASSNLNELQKKVILKNLQTALKDGDLKDKYENNTDLFNEAVETYISSLKFGDFETVSADILASFKASDAYQGVEKNLQIRNIISSEEFYNALTANISQTLADTIVNDGKYLDVMKEIQAEAQTKAQDGEFDTNGALDNQKAIDWLVKEISSRLSEFYPNGFSDMTLDELSTMYDKLAEAADKTSETDTDAGLKAHRDAAIKYCDALAEKSPKFKELVTTVFNSSSYSSAINKLYPSEIQEKIENLKLKVAELGDANELTLADASWGDLPTSSTNMSLEKSRTSAISFISEKLQELQDKLDETRGSGIFKIQKRLEARSALYGAKAQLETIFGSSDYTSVINSLDAETLAAKMKEVNNIFDGEDWTPVGENGEQVSSSIIIPPGKSKTFNITPSFLDKDGNAKTITSDRITYKTSNSSIAKVDSSGNMTIQGTSVGTYTVTITVLVDGVEIGTNTITIDVKECDDTIDFTKINYMADGDKEVISGSLRGSGTEFQTDLQTNLTGDISTVSAYITNLYDTLANGGQLLDLDALSKAKDKLIDLYSTAMKHIYSETWQEGRLKRGKGHEVSFDYNGVTYKASMAQDDDGKEFATNASGQQAANNQLGLWLYVKTDRKAYGVQINTQCLMDWFQKFYQEALG